jgi:hypothetical protein
MTTVKVITVSFSTTAQASVTILDDLEYSHEDMLKDVHCIVGANLRTPWFYARLSAFPSCNINLCSLKERIIGLQICPSKVSSRNFML